MAADSRAALRRLAPWIGLAAVVACAVAAVGADRFFAAPSPDFLHGYHPGARSLAAGNGYTGDNGRLITHWPPGYSILIAPFASDDPQATLVTLRAVMAVLALVNVVLLGLLVARVLPRAPGWLMLVLVAWPPLVPLANPAGSEMLFALLVNAGLLLLVLMTDRRRVAAALALALAAGVLLGAAAMTKTLGLAIIGAAVIALFAAWHGHRLRRRLAASACLLVGATVIILPWALGVQRQTGRLAVSTAGMASIRDGFARFPDFDAGRELDARRDRWHSPGPLLADLADVAVRHPLSFASLVAVKLARPWYATDSGRHADVLFWLQAPWLVAFVVVCLRTLRRWRAVPMEVILLIGVVAAVWLSAAMVLSVFRYLAPVFPLVVLAVAWHGADAMATAGPVRLPRGARVKLLSVVMPVFNEVRTIEEIVRRVQAVDLPIGRELVIVDDGSTDGTRDRLKLIEAGHDNVRVVLHDRNRGKGAALKTGFAHVRGDVVLIQDADLEYDPGDYRDLLEPVLDGRADVVFGSRFITTRPRRVLYYWHYVANRLLTTLSNCLTNLNLTDMETCYKVFRREVVERLELREKRFGIEPELTARIAAMGCRVYEVGISYSGRTYEEGKKIGLRDGLRALWCILRYNVAARLNRQRLRELSERCRLSSATPDDDSRIDLSPDRRSGS